MCGRRRSPLSLSCGYRQRRLNRQLFAGRRCDEGVDNRGELGGFSDEGAGRPPGSVKLVALSWFYQLRPGETWEAGVDQGFGSGPISSCITNAGFMNEHVDELGADIVNASTQAAMAYLGDPTAADAPHYLEVWSKYLRGLDPVHRPLITKELVDYWCLYGTPEQLQEKTQHMLDAGVDMVSVFLSNPFTAQRDIADIGSSILAHA
jgi:hypothetical protein